MDDTLQLWFPDYFAYNHYEELKGALEEGELISDANDPKEALEKVLKESRDMISRVLAKNGLRIAKEFPTIIENVNRTIGYCVAPKKSWKEALPKLKSRDDVIPTLDALKKDFFDFVYDREE